MRSQTSNKNQSNLSLFTRVGMCCFAFPDCFNWNIAFAPRAMQLTAVAQPECREPETNLSRFSLVFCVHFQLLERRDQWLRVVTSSLPHARRWTLNMHRSNKKCANTWKKTRICTPQRAYAWWREYIYFDETQAFKTHAWMTPSWLCDDFQAHRCIECMRELEAAKDQGSSRLQTSQKTLLVV